MTMLGAPTWSSRWLVSRLLSQADSALDMPVRFYFLCHLSCPCMMCTQRLVVVSERKGAGLGGASVLLAAHVPPNIRG